MRIRSVLYKLLILIFISPIVFIIVVYLNYQFISFTVRDKIYDDIRKVPYRDYTLVPGSGKLEYKNWINHILLHRLLAVEKLYFNNKTQKIIVSGSTTVAGSNEPAEMKRYFIETGISENHILTDTVGIRTWKSVDGVMLNFPGEKVIIVSQREHLERALFISECLGVDAVGFIAKPSPDSRRYWTIREYLARMKCIYDCVTYKFTP